MKKQEIPFSIEGDYIDLLQLLKATGIASTGGHAKILVEEGLILRNGEPEFRKRAKLLRGDVVEMKGIKVRLQ
jgi:ribosome-associated protein